MSTIKSIGKSLLVLIVLDMFYVMGMIQVHYHWSYWVPIVVGVVSGMLSSLITQRIRP